MSGKYNTGDEKTIEGESVKKKYIYTMINNEIKNKRLKKLIIYGSCFRKDAEI